MTPAYSMYDRFRFWGKLKSLRKYMHFNILERPNIFNMFLTFSIQILTFPFNIFFRDFKKNEVSPSSIIFIGNHRQIIGRSWADHGYTMGDRFMQKILKISAFSIPFFSKTFWKFAIFPRVTSKASSYFCRPR